MTAQYALDPRNARVRDAKAKETLRKSLEAFGAGRSIVIDKNDVVISGNGVYEQAQALGIKVREIETDGEELIVVKRTDLETADPRRIGLALADNQTATLAKWDEVKLEELKTEVLDFVELGAMGFDEPPAPDDSAEVGEMIDRAEELNEKWGVERGQVWEIPGKAGIHRVMCGDSTDAGDVALLMDGKKAGLTITDPPYNVGIKYGEGTNDKQGRAQYAAWSSKWLQFLPSRRLFTVGIKRLMWWESIAGEPQWIIAWVKRNGQGNTRLGGTNKWDAILVYDCPLDGGIDMVECLNDYSEGIRSKGSHPTAKPVGLWRMLIARFALTEDILYEPFLGSGTTVVAAENENRICFGCDVEPKYVAVSLERLTALGLRPVRCAP